MAAKKEETTTTTTVEVQPITPKKQVIEPEYINQYRRYYPRNSIFYVTSDDMVFLENQEDAARRHQEKIGRGELQTF